MKAKHILPLLAALSIPAVIAYDWYRFMCFPGDRGPVYETWESSNENFKVRMTAYHEVGIYMPGAFYTCESAPAGTDEWRVFKDFRGDDAVPLSRLNRRFRFVDGRTAYFFTADDFSVTLDAGRNWSVWKPILTRPDGERVYWAIIEAHVEPDGTGKARLWDYDDRIKDAVTLEISTKDYGRSWDALAGAPKREDVRFVF